MVKLKRVSRWLLLAATLSWGSSVTLGLLFAACATGHFWLGTLALPGVVPVALLISTQAAILMMPVAMWSLRTGMKNLCFFGPILWLILATYILLGLQNGPPLGPYGLLLLAAVGGIGIGFIPPRERKQHDA